MFVKDNQSLRPFRTLAPRNWFSMASDSIFSAFWWWWKQYCTNALNIFLIIHKTVCSISFRSNSFLIIFIWLQKASVLICEKSPWIKKRTKTTTPCNLYINKNCPSLGNVGTYFSFEFGMFLQFFCLKKEKLISNFDVTIYGNFFTTTTKNDWR